MIQVSYGGGDNSTAAILGMYERGERIDLILFADPGAEMPHTTAHNEKFNTWLIAHGLPEITTVKKVDENGDILTLEEDCLRRNQLPAVAYGFRTCSQKYKIQPQEKFMNNYPPMRAVWARGERVTRIIGYHAEEPGRANQPPPPADKKYINRFPLIEWGWGRQQCVDAIRRHGFEPPGKSACFYCPNSTKRDVLKLKDQHPDLLERALKLESNADLQVIKGLGRGYFNWGQLVARDDAQLTILQDVEQAMPCGCHDGGEDL